MYRIKNIFIILLLILVPININALTYPSELSEYSYLDYVIDTYDVDIVVNENNTLDITETINAYFNTYKHGIYRTIPLSNKVMRTDGTTSKNHTKVTNVGVNNKFTTSRENGNYKIKIGDEDTTLIGNQTYVIKYTYSLGKDPLKDSDELYYNIIGTEWDTVIGNVTFTITMPKSFDSSNLGFTYGSFGSSNTDNINYEVDGNVIHGSYDGILSIGEGLTIRCTLDEGYFTYDGLSTNIYTYLIYSLPILFLAISFLFWYLYGRDDEVIETVEFYPPNDLNSLDIGYLYKGFANNKDVTSLLIYLANKGYIKISDIEGKSKKFKITKLKEYDGNNEAEQIFLDGLFKNNTLNEVTDSDLYNEFYTTMQKILAKENSKKNKYKIFEKSASTKSKYIIIMMIISYLIITIIPLLEYGYLDYIVPALMFPGITITVLVGMLTNDSNKNNTPVIVFSIIFGLLFGGIPFVIFVLPSLIEFPLYIVCYVIGILSIIGMQICLAYLPKRTPYGNEMLGKIRGFKNFLVTAEKDKLEALVMENPTYFYNILPYTYALGISDKWIKKFETINLQAPTWYDSTNTFDVVVFSSFMNNTMSSAERVMTSSPSSDSSSGGGFSGGGSGGGGGGSW